MEKVAVSLLLMLICSVRCSNFGHKPAEGYFMRNNISDCPQRFYRTEWDDEHRPFVPQKAVPAVSGGIRAFNGEYPHMAAIGWTVGETIQYKCGGTLIHPKFVLTAAHCAVTVEGSLPSTIRLGDTDLSSFDDDKFSKQISIRSIRRHPLHRFSRAYHDIALIELETEVQFSSSVHPACLWREDEIPSETLRVIGFGELEEAGGNSPTLQQGFVNLLSKELCIAKLRTNRRIPDGLIDSQFCASHETMDTCQGDSGGPIEVRRVDLFDQLHPVIVGVTSFGTPCTNGSTGVYTKIVSYIDWIESEIKENLSYQACIDRPGFRELGYNLLRPLNIPAYAHLLQNSSLSSQYGCAGTLIDDRFALTSASCVTDSSKIPKFIYFSDFREIVQIDEIITHPEYKSDNSSKDIALLKLSKYLNPDSFLRPICLEESDTSHNRLYSFVLRNNKPLNSTGEIITYHSKNIRQPDENCAEITNINQICAQNSLNLIPNICQIDIGGPILSVPIPPTKIPYLEGITGPKSEKCDGKLYGTKVRSHIKWIESVIFGMQLDDVLIFT